MAPAGFGTKGVSLCRAIWACVSESGRVFVFQATSVSCATSGQLLKSVWAMCPKTVKLGAIMTQQTVSQTGWKNL